MYFALIAVLLLLAGFTIHRGATRRRFGLVGLGVGIVILTVLGFGAMTFLAEVWWYDALGYEHRFWTAIGWQVGLAAAGGLMGAACLYAVTLRLRQPTSRVWPELAGLAVGIGVGAASWEEVALLVHGRPTGLEEPILGLDASFYLFAVPVIDHAFGMLLWLGAIAIAAVVVDQLTAPEAERGPERGVVAVSVFAAVIAAAAQVRGIFHLLYSDWGVVAGPGWTDVHVRLPILVGLAVLFPLIALTPLVPAVRRRAARLWARTGPTLAGSPALAAVGTSWLLIGALWAVLLGAVPAVVQWLVVQPNELAYETPYIENNIALTRIAFGLDEVEERQFPADQALTPGELANHEEVLREVRLWDWRALDDVYAQFQEFRLYYEFMDVDVDRYRLGDRYRQVMISPRELAQANLPAQSQTFVNQVFKYTHGYGLTLAPVHEFTPDGLPQLLVKNIPPVSAYPELAVTVPQIYYGELGGPVVVNSATPEFDHPQGEQNVYNQYDGRGGVRLATWWHRLVYGWTHFGTRLLLSGYPTSESRVMYHRTIRERVHRVAPFLRLDDDPYLVLVEGRLAWIQDAYTVSSYFPYSEPYDPREEIQTTGPAARVGPGTDERLVTTTVPGLGGVNYVRNSVKAVVDAYHGTVTLYVFAPDDPLVQAWSGVFPGLFRDGAEMPEPVRAHVRYPADYLLVQGRVHAKYHMTDPVVFYNQEDLWVRATEQHYGRVVPVDPYYVMWQLPEATTPEFALILPFTPRNRQVAIGWIAGLSDGENYGRFLAYQFPKDQRVIGPQQVETKIDQDPNLSAQLSLWDQRGSRVLRGNVLAIPLGDSLLYVEPIYLRAETAAYPELRLVVLMIGDEMVYATNFADALELLVAAEAAEPVAEQDLAAPDGPGPGDLETAPVGIGALAREADALFREYVRLQGAGDFEQAGRVLQQLSDVLERLSTAPAEGS